MIEKLNRNKLLQVKTDCDIERGDKMNGIVNLNW